MNHLMKRVTMSVLVTALVASMAIAHSIDYLASSTSFNGLEVTPAGVSNNINVVQPVAPGQMIEFTLTFKIVAQGRTTLFPRTVVFEGKITDNQTHLSASDGNVSITNKGTCSFSEEGDQCTQNVTITAPSVSGTYTAKILPTNGTGGKDGLESGGGMAVNFTVSASTCEALPTAISMADSCILYHQAETIIPATLTSNDSPLAGRLMEFGILQTLISGSDATDGNGTAHFTPATNGLSVGDHTLTASFAGEECKYQPTSASANLGVTYIFVGYQQPINADGNSVFKAVSIPVKIRITDANGQPVPDADAHVFFSYITGTVVGTEFEAVPQGNGSGDTGNKMTYDPADDQYGFIWDIAGLDNGTYQVRVGLGEGQCGEPHTVTLSINRKKAN